MESCCVSFLLLPLTTGTTLKTEQGAEPEATVKEEDKEEKREKEEKKERDIMRKEEKDKERERERERPTRISGSSSGGVIKEEKDKPGSSSQPEELSGERLAMVGGSKRKEMEQLKIVRAELK